ncbi:non-ribosomal peptide synthetase [Streptomyces sp. NBC_01565]|uniref:non-ribosomal peptide synthetase n=1 Tax=Streptomyces sp. NBC_01565 TaxID=2975881 RepID=UPI002256BC48|nr:non-ribosomal peptide synthetase [Streptomyces sp. NBC_01565]MCX4539267.1 non-ribosomal peptide synthetase [Streptomyces sp. NBC_01565]
MTPPQTPAPAYRRPVSPTEHLYLAAGHARGAMALRIVVEGHTAPEPAALRAAVARAAEVCPGSRLVRRGPVWTAEGPLPTVRYAAPAAGRLDVSDPATAALLTGPSRRDDTPGCGVLVVPGTSADTATLVFSASHALMDGHGALTWVREVFSALRGEPGRPALAPDTDRGLLRRLGASARRPALVPDRPSPLGRPAPGPEQTLWLRRTLPGHHRALTARLAQALTDSAATAGARSGGAVADSAARGGALTGGAARVGARSGGALTDSAARGGALSGSVRPGSAGRGGTRVMIPVDLRRHRPGIVSTGNLTLPLFLDLSPGQEWPTAQVTLLRALAENQELAEGFESALLPLPSAAGRLLLRAAQAGAVRADRHLASAVVSHLGRLDPAEFSGGGFTATTLYALPVHAPLVPVSMAATETDTATELTMGVRGGPDLAERTTRLLDEVLTHLPASAPPAPTAAPASAMLAGPALGTRPEPAVPAGYDALPAATPHARSKSAPSATPEPAPAVEPEPAPPATVVELFRAQAARTPGAPALDGPGGVVTYAELDRRSDAVAAGLLRRGIGREDLVGLVVDRTPAGVCALWGILKAGAAYVPLDPAHPAARTAEILRACGARLCLTQRHLAEPLGALAPCPLLAAEDLVTGPPPRPVPPAPAPEDLAYVIHTSGSAGRPKGVQIEHRGLAGFVRWMTQVCRVDARTRFGFASSYGFDISCFPLFLPLLAGGTVVLAPDAPSRATLRRLVTDHRADTLALTPSHLPLLPDAGAGADTHHIRTLLLGGEPLTPAAVRTARTAFGPDCRIINGYGPTEATVVCLAHVVDDARPTTAATLPIGTPGPYARVDLVTEDGERIGTGAEDTGRTGEIVVSGAQVARGYLGPPDGRPSPFTGHEDGTRTYRTGDLGRRLPGGAVEFAGRIDDQLKIAGHRIEPAEIVAALEARPEVSRAVVAVRRRPHTTTPVLCAYVVPRADGSYVPGTAPKNPKSPESPNGPGNPHGPGLPATLRSALTAALPAAMVPAHVITVDAIPSTVGGKADLDALPDPFTPAPDSAHDRAEPATLQARVAAHWAAILAVDPTRLSAESDFQTLGGDSLALVEMLTAVSDDLLEPAQARRFMAGLDCLVRNLTLAQVCAHLADAREELPA